MPTENETPDVDETPDETPDVESTEVDETPDETPDESTDSSDETPDASDDNPGTPDSSDETANANAMIETLNATIEGLNVANEQLQSEQSIAIQALNSTITELRAELWTISKTLPNDSVSTEDDSAVEAPPTFDDLAAKATAKESE